MGFQGVSRAIDARCLLDSAILTPLTHYPSREHHVSSNDSDVNNCVLMPWVGFGTYRLGKRQSRTATFEAIKSGYRQIDTAFVYGGQTTEIEVGKALQDAWQQSVIKSRQDVFITTKQWREYHGYDASMKCLELSLERLGLDYVDMWMMHWPGPCFESRDKRQTNSSENAARPEDDPWCQGGDLAGKGYQHKDNKGKLTWCCPPGINQPMPEGSEGDLLGLGDYRPSQPSQSS